MDAGSSLIKHIKNIDDIHSADDCKKYLDDLSDEFNIAHYWYMTVDKKPEAVNQHGINPKTLINNYPKEFVEDYVDNNRFKIDPVVLHSLDMQEGVSLWDELFNRDTLTDDHAGQLEWAAQYNIENGLSTMIDHPTHFTMLHLALPKNFDRKASSNEKQLVKQILPITYMISKQLPISNDQQLECRLSSRESECLEWAARGKTVWETAAIIGISENTVREYLSNATKKLIASNKTEAVVKATLLGAIDQQCLIDFWQDPSSTQLAD